MSFLANIYKDITIYFTKSRLISAILSLILPLLLLPTLIFTVDDLTFINFVHSFPIAVRDDDDTLMSHSLLSQLSALEIFSDVRLLSSETDAEAVSDGAVAVATIPKDFFYDLYDMKECPVNVTVNTAFPLEATIFTSVFRSVMSIINSNHAAAIGAYTFVYGDLTPELTDQMRKTSGDRLVYDALGRLRFFSDVAAVPDLVSALLRRLSACVLGVMALFFALISAKTLPEERRLGVLPRLRAAGAKTAPFLLSKLLMAALLSLPTVAVTAAVLKMSVLYVFAVYFLLLTCAFCGMAALSVCVGSAASAQRFGNVAVLLNLVLGGVLWPAGLLPGVLAPLSKLTLPHYALLALEARAGGFNFAETLALMWPLLIISALPVALAAIFLAFYRGKTAKIPEKVPVSPELDGKTSPMAVRALRLTLLRLRQAAGGPVAAVLTLTAAVACGFCAGELTRAQPGALRLMVRDLDRTELSQELTSRLRADPGVDLIEIDGDGKRELLSGEREGLVIIGEGYAESLTSDVPALSFEAASSSVSAQAARELVAGKAVAQHRGLEAVEDAEKMVGRELTTEEKAELREEIAKAERGLPPLYNISYTSGSAPTDPFAPKPMGLACLAALFTLFTAAAYTGAPDAKSAQRRLRAIPGGAGLGLASDFAALTALGFAVTALVLIPAGEGAGALPAALAASAAMAAIALALTSGRAAEGRVDTLAPLAALLICALGGSFMDLSAVTGPLRAVTYISPAAIAALPAHIAVPALLGYAGVIGAFAWWGRVRRE